MSSSYTWCNSYKVTNFLHRRFLKDLMVKKNIIKCYYFPSDNLINTTIFFSLPLFITFHLLKGTPPFSRTCKAQTHLQKSTLPLHDTLEIC